MELSAGDRGKCRSSIDVRWILSIVFELSVLTADVEFGSELIESQAVKYYYNIHRIKHFEIIIISPLPFSLKSQDSIMSTAQALANLAATGNAAAQRMLQQMSTMTNPAAARPSDPPQDEAGDSKTSAKESEVNNQEDGLEDEQEITYTPYRPKKLTYGRNHPDPVVENSTLASVEPPDITYNLAMPADILSEGKLSNLQLEAIVYGCQRHMVDLPMAPSSKENVPMDAEVITPPRTRAGFLLGDGAGMGKGRTLAGFVIENISRGRKKHVWISVSSDLYEDAKRDLSDLGLGEYADKNCFNLGKLPYGRLGGGNNQKKNKKTTGKQKKKQPVGDYEEGVMFCTYSALIGKKKSTGESRLEQLLDWCGEDFDGLIMLDECHKVCQSLIDLHCLLHRFVHLTKLYIDTNHHLYNRPKQLNLTKTAMPASATKTSNAPRQPPK